MIYTGLIMQERYCILECRERGEGFCLYLAEDLKEEKRCLIKVSRNSLRREARLLERFSHPLLPAYTDCLQFKEASVLVLKERKGKLLKRMLEEGEGPEAAEIPKLYEALLDLLVYLHGQTPPVYCPWIRPENLLYGEEGLTLLELGSVSPGQTEDLKILEGCISEMMRGRILPNPHFYLFRLRCRLTNGRIAFESAEAALASYRREKQQHRKESMILAAAAILLLGTAGFVHFHRLPFETALSRVTEAYWTEDLPQMEPEERKEFCRQQKAALVKLEETYEKKKDFLTEQEEVLKMLCGEEQTLVPKEICGKLMRALAVLEEKKRERAFKVCVYETEFEGSELSLIADAEIEILSVRCDKAELAEDWDGQELHKTVKEGRKQLRVMYISTSGEGMLHLEG